MTIIVVLYSRFHISSDECHLACVSSSDLLSEGDVWQEYVSLESKYEDFPRERAIKLCKSAVSSLQNDFAVLVGDYPFKMRLISYPTYLS